MKLDVVKFFSISLLSNSSIIVTIIICTLVIIPEF